jgi:hypothetical protein
MDGGRPDTPGTALVGSLRAVVRGHGPGPE